MFEVRNGVLIFLTSTINKEPVEQAKRKSLGPVEMHNAQRNLKSRI